MTPEHLTRQVERLREKWPDTRVVGVHATRWQGGTSITVDGERFPVQWCESALALSERLTGLGEEERLIVLNPLADKNLSLDVRARLARGRLFHPDRWQMVCDAYGVAAVDPRLPMRPWMADALLSARPRQGRSKARVLDADTAWLHVLDHRLGIPDGSPDAGAILRWSMEPSAAERFARLPAPLAEAVTHRLGQSAGGLGTLMASGIASGHATELLPIGLVCDVLFSDVNGALDPTLLQATARLEPLLGAESVEPKRGREWAEVARRQLLGGDEHPEVGALFGAIHRAVRARREERNRAFAVRLSEWLTGARGQGIVPIEHRVGRRSRTSSDRAGAHRFALERDRSIRIETKRLSRRGFAAGGGRRARRLAADSGSISTLVVGRIAECGRISSSGAGTEVGKS